MPNCVVSASTMQSIENRFITENKATINTLMEKAGKKLAEVISDETSSGKVVFFCGKGNNGGDGITAAALLAETLQPIVFVFAAKNELSEASSNALGRYKAKLVFNPDQEQIKEEVAASSIIADCLFGFGFKGTIEGPAADAVNIINESGKTVISADIPSGVEATSGLAGPVSVIAAKTVSFTCAKLGHFLPPGSFMRGELVIADIGIEVSEPDALFTDKTTVAGMLPERFPQMHKKTAGSVLIIGGSKDYTGAVVMSALAALRSGAGYVTIACPDEICAIVKEKATEPVIKCMPSVNGALGKQSLEQLLSLAEQHSVTLLGPGLSLSPETIELTDSFLKEFDGLCVVDADAITAAARSNTPLNDKILLTPHSGEFSRLINVNTENIESDRYNLSTDFAKNNHTNIFLKGPFSIITNGEKTYFNPTGNTGLATAGTGDVLSGLIAGFAAQSENLFEGAVIGGYIHGLAADIAAAELTQYSLIATDLLPKIPDAMKTIVKS